MEKEPWEEDVYDDGEEKLKRIKKVQANQADRILTVLAAIFLVLVIAVACFLTYLSIGGSNKNTSMEGFYGTSAAVASSSSVEQAASSEAAAAPEGETTESSEGTITVQAGEGEAAIAARAGISIAKLEQLNPSHMSTGSWYANPGDVVKIQ